MYEAWTRQQPDEEAIAEEPQAPALAMAVRPEDLNLPNAVITRTLREALLDSVSISKQAWSPRSHAANIFVL